MSYASNHYALLGNVIPTNQLRYWTDDRTKENGHSVILFHLTKLFGFSAN